MSLPKANAVSRLSLFAFIFVSLTFVFVKFRQIHSVEPFIRDSYALSWDNYGYYLHLPAAVIHHDVGLEDKVWVDSLNNKYQKDRPFYQVWPGQKNRMVNVYPVGLAVCNLPFFLGGHVWAKMFGYSPDGLSPPYQWAMILSALFFGILGMWWLRKLVLKFFSDKLSAVLLLLIGLGTNLYYYATYNNILPHIFLFALDTQIVLLTIAWHERQRAKTALLIGMLIGLVTIVRPSEIVWILIPLFWNVSGWQSLKEKFRLLLGNFTHVLLLIFGMVAIGSLQLFYWKYTSGHWFSFNHTEGFDFFRPFTMQVLFSYKKGWLLYTPLMILSICGIFLLYKKQKPLFLPVLIFFLANLWFISSWECWWYGGSFGQRPFVQSYGLMAIPLGYMIWGMNRIRNIIISVLLGFFFLLNQFQTWQMDAGIIHGELMTKKYYWKVFGKTSVQPEWNSLLEIDRGNLPPLGEVQKNYTEHEVMNLDFEKPDANIPKDLICDTLGLSGTHCLRLNAANPYGAPFRKPFCELTSKDHLRLQMEMQLYMPGGFQQNTFYFVLSIKGSRGQSYGYTAISPRMIRMEDNGWVMCSADFVTPYILHRDDEVNVNIWDSGGEEMFIDNVVLTVYEPK
jgi:hypothetical protein